MVLEVSLFSVAEPNSNLGARAAIPPNADLIFETELIAINGDATP